MMSAAEIGGDHESFAASRVGSELRAARMRAGWSIADVSAALRIRRPFLEAIEEGRTEELPGAAYAVGFVRSYAQAMGLDPDEIGRRFRAEGHEVNRKTELSFPAPVPERGVPAGAVVLVGLVIAIGAYAAWYKVSSLRHGDADLSMPERLATMADRAPPSTASPQVASILPPPSAPVVTPTAPTAAPLSIPSAAQAAPVAPPVPLPVPIPVPVTIHPPPAAEPAPETAPAPAADASRVVLKFRADSYIQVREKQGPVLLNRVMRAGESWPVPTEPHLIMTTGNAGGTDIVVDGITAASLGPSGAVRRDVSLEPTSIKLPPGVKLPATPRG